MNLSRTPVDPHVHISTCIVSAALAQQIMTKLNQGKIGLLHPTGKT